MLKKTVNPKSMKKENKRVILRYLVENGPCSRGAVAEKTGLAHSAVWRITDELLKEGLIEEKGLMSGKRRKATVYGPTRAFVTSVIYNVEVMETLVAIGYLDGFWKIVEKFPTPEKFEDFKAAVESSFKTVQSTYPLNVEISKIVFSVPGMVNSKEKILIHAPNLNWRMIDFQKAFKDLELDVLVENDANLSLFAEHFFSHDVKESEVSFFLYLGEGIGGAVSVGGNIVRGKDSAAGEIGHVILNLEDLKEVEYFLSVSRLISRIEGYTELDGNSLEEKYHFLKRMWFTGDGNAKKALEHYLYNMAIVMRNVIYLLNPGIIILGGLINDLWETFGPYIKRHLERMVEKEIFTGIIRDTIFKDVPPSLVGGNILVIEDFLRNLI